MKKILFTIAFLCSTLFSINGFSKDEEEQPEEIDSSVIIDRINNDDIEVSIPSLIFTFTDAEIKLKFKNPEHTKLLLNKNKINFIINGADKTLTFINGEASFINKFNNSNSLSIYTEEFSFNQKVTAYPLWAILAPVVLILFWIIRRVMKK